MLDYLMRIVEACRSKYGLAAVPILLAVLCAIVSACSLTETVNVNDGSTYRDQPSLTLSGELNTSANTSRESMTEEPQDKHPDTESSQGETKYNKE